MESMSTFVVVAPFQGTRAQGMRGTTPRHALLIAPAEDWVPLAQTGALA